MLATNLLRATDHNVAVGGTGSTFPNIGAAMSAAVDGDRILVQPGTYAAFSIDKSVEVLALSPDSSFTVAGDIAVYTAPDRKVTLCGANVLGKLLHPDAGFSPATVAITAIGCVFSNVDLPSGYAELRLHACTVKGQLTFARGTITGCRIKGDPVHIPAGEPVISLTSGGPSGNMSAHRYLIGNIIGELLPATFATNVLSLETDAPFTVSNNYIHGTSGPQAKPVVKVKKPKQEYLQVTLAECNVSSFSMRVAGNGTVPWLEDSVSMFVPAFTALLQNNFIVNAQPFTGNSGSFPQAFNVVTASASAIDPVTGAPTVGSLAINAGDPATAYLDLDLSRNDAGCWGGSWSMANFPSPGPGARTALVLAPRSVVIGQPLPISATGFQR